MTKHNLNRLREALNQVYSEFKMEYRITEFTEKFGREAKPETLKYIDISRQPFNDAVGIILSAFDEEGWKSEKEFDVTEMSINISGEIENCIRWELVFEPLPEAEELTEEEMDERSEERAEFICEIAFDLLDFFKDEYLVNQDAVEDLEPKLG